MDPQNPQNSNPTPPSTQYPAPPQPPPPAQSEYGYGYQGQTPDQYGYGQQQPAYAYPYPVARQGFPMWAWGAIGAAALFALMGVATLIAILAGSGSNSGNVPGNVPPLIQQNANLGPPQWIRPGLRVSYYSAAASVAQSRFAWVEDPTGPWLDAKTGKRYRRTDEGDQDADIPNQDISTASGDGISQIDVLAVEGSDIVFSQNLYGIDRTSNPPAFVPPVASGGKVPGVAVDGTWINPALLAQLQEYNNAGLLVLRGDYVVNGVTYKAISFANTSPTNYLQYTYDTETGLLLSATTRTKGATSPIAAQGEAPPSGNTQLTITRFAGYRHRTLPGINSSKPAWLANTNQLYYSGNYMQTNPLDPTTGGYSYPMEVSVTFGAGGANWAPFTLRSQSQGSQPTEASGVTGPLGLYWIDPQALASVSPQQVLDQDPVTGETLQVGSVDSGRVTIVSRLPGVETSTTYDQNTGVLVGYRMTAPRSGATIELGLQRGP